MTPRERLISALNLEEVDRVPIFPYGIDPFNRKLWMYQYPSYEPLLNLVREKCDVMYGHKGGLGIDAGVFLSATSQIKYWSRSHRNGEVTIVKRVIETPKGPITSITVRREGFPPRVVKGWIETDEDLERFLSIPYEPPRPDLSFFFEEERRIGYRAAMSLNAPEPIGVVAPLFL